MGFNRRKMEDQRRDAAEKEAAARRATDAQTCTSATGVCASPDTAAAARSQSIHSQYRASTELQTHNTFNTKHNTFNTKQRSK